MRKLLSLLGTILITMTTSCVQETHLKTVTIKLDMNGVSEVENVGIKGSFTNPSWKEIISLTDENNDGIYETILSQKTAVSRIQFKFINQGNYELKNQPNRSLAFEYKPQTIVYKATFDISEAKITIQ